MLEVLSIFLREGFEIILLLGIIIVYLEKTRRHAQLKFVYTGTVLAVAASIFLGIILHSIKSELSKTAEAILFFITAFFVLSVILWFYYGSRHITKGFAHKLDKWQGLGILFFTFLIIFREGAEIVLLLLTAKSIITEAMIGTIIIIILGYFMIKGSLKIDLRRFYKITSIMLYIIFVQLIIHGFLELHETNIINLGILLQPIEFFIDGIGQYIISGTLFALMIILIAGIKKNSMLSL